MILNWSYIWIFPKIGLTPPQSPLPLASWILHSLPAVAATDSRDDTSWLVACSFWNMDWQRPAPAPAFPRYIVKHFQFQRSLRTDILSSNFQELARRLYTSLESTLNGIIITYFLLNSLQSFGIFYFSFLSQQILQTHPCLQSQLLWFMTFALDLLDCCWSHNKRVSPDSTFSATSWLQDSHQTEAKPPCVRVR